MVGQRVVSIVLLPILTRVLNRADYGMLSLLEQSTIVPGLILFGTFSSALGYFHFEKDTESQRRAVVGTVIGGALLLGCLASLICWPFAGVLARVVFKTITARPYLLIVFIIMPVDFFVSALLSWLRVDDRPRVFVMGSVLQSGVSAAGIIILVGIFRTGVLGYLYSSLAALVVTAVVLRAADVSLPPVPAHDAVFRGNWSGRYRDVRDQLWRSVYSAPLWLAGQRRYLFAGLPDRNVSSGGLFRV